MLPMLPWRHAGHSGDIAQLRRDMSDFLSRFWGGDVFGHGSPVEWSPSLDVSETDGKIEVKAELPGLEAKDIDVSVSGDLLTLRGEKAEDVKKEDEKFFFRECYSGAFQRTVRLPTEVDPENVSANFKNGVLTIEMPKSKAASSRKIEVTSS
jgi:HSP20 family protein